MKSILIQQSEDVFKYHVIPNEQIFPDHIHDGTLKSTLLGNSYHIMFHMSGKNEVCYCESTFYMSPTT